MAELTEQDINNFFKVGQQDSPQTKQKFVVYQEPKTAAGNETNEDIERLKSELLQATQNAHKLGEQHFIKEVERQKAIEKAEKAHQEYIQACKQQQDAVRLTNQTRVDIMKGFKNGLSDAEIMYLRCKAISALTGDTLIEQKARERTRKQN